ncbi:response regulator transcription factor [Actinophytocola sp.]|uniref:response regulator transcription factor n=1 Tax=Actinophytocola sp. TaxID=1872138 RepID=UPI002D80E5B4|nr:response regulator transcription factor [Actinophytocola sp.]HET9137800.1 response regulator transcription factor [Actinophytocola sp.]
MLDHRDKVRPSDRPPAPRPGPTELTVLVADDHPGVVGHLHGLLSAAAGMTVLTGTETVVLARRHQPDVLVLDVATSGTEKIREVLRVAPEVAVLVYTARADDESVLTAVRAGCRGYLLHGSTDEDIVRAVRGIAAGEAIFGQDIAPRVLDLLANPGAAGPLPKLTDRERALLDLLAAGHGNAAIAAELKLAPKTVSNLISALLGKLGVPDRESAVRAVRNHRHPGRRSVP